MSEMVNQVSTRKIERLRLIPHSGERRIILFLGDLAALVVAASLALWFSEEDPAVWWLLVPVVSWFFLAVLTDSYNLHTASKRMQSVPRVLLATAASTMIYLLVYFVFSRQVADSSPLNINVHIFFSDYVWPAPPRLLPAIFLFLGTVLLVSWRITFANIFTSPSLRRRAVIIGAGLSGRALVHDTRNAVNTYEFVGFVDDDPGLQGIYVAGLKVLGGYNYLNYLVDNGEIDTIVLATPHETHNEILARLIPYYEKGITVQAMATLYEDTVRRVPVEHLDPQWFLTAMNKSFPTLDYVFKRLIDIVFGLLGFLVLALILPFVALAIYLDSPGPIFYRQERLGLRGKPFWVFKFRSMVPDAEKVGQAKWAVKGDPRVTRIGRFMRLTRIDEIPQVLNILRGEMSVVGPRPERPQFVEQLEQEIPYYRTRLSVKPGLTGWAQVKYRYGASVEDAMIKLKYDLFYIKNQSIILDLLIIFRTIGVVLFMKGN